MGGNRPHGIWDLWIQAKECVAAKGRRISVALIRGPYSIVESTPDSASLHPGLYSGAPYQELKNRFI